METKTETIDLELKDLDQFYGTQGYINVMGINVTDGVAYVMKNGYSWLITDSIAVIKMKLKQEPFLSIKLKLNGTKAEMIITDGDCETLYTQKYEYTNAKTEIKMFCTNGVLMLCREY